MSYDGVPPTQRECLARISSLVGWRDAERLFEYVGVRAACSLAAGAAIGLTTALLPLFTVAAGALLGASGRSGTLVVLGAFIALIGPTIARLLWRRRAWRTPVERRLAEFESSYAGQRMVTVAVCRSDVSQATRCLRRDGLFVPVGRWLGVPPEDAAELTLQLSAFEPMKSRAPSTEEYWQRVGRVLHGAGIEYRQTSSGTSLGPGSAFPALPR